MSDEQPGTGDQNRTPKRVGGGERNAKVTEPGTQRRGLSW